MPWGKKWPVQINLPFFAVKAYVPGGGSRIRPKNIREMPSGTGTKFTFPALYIWGCAERTEKASCGETVVQNAKMDSNIFSINSMVFKRFKSKPSLKTHPKDPAVLKILLVVDLLSHCDLLSRHTLCGHHFPGNYRHFPSQRRVRGVVSMGGVVKTLRRSKNTIFTIVVVFLVRKGPLGKPQYLIFGGFFSSKYFEGLNPQNILRILEIFGRPGFLRIFKNIEDFLVSFQFLPGFCH